MLHVGDTILVEAPWLYAGTPQMPAGWISGRNQTSNEVGAFPASHITYADKDISDVPSLMKSNSSKSEYWCIICICMYCMY